MGHHVSKAAAPRSLHLGHPSQGDVLEKLSFNRRLVQEMRYGVMLARQIRRLNPDVVLMGNVPVPMMVVVTILRPVVFVLNAIANTVLRLMRVEPRDEVESTFSDDELARMVADSSEAGLLDDRSTERLRDALELGRRPVSKVARPLERVVSAPLGVTPEELERLSAESGFSRFPVVDAQGRAREDLTLSAQSDAVRVGVVEIRVDGRELRSRLVIFGHDGLLCLG